MKHHLTVCFLSAFACMLLLIQRSFWVYLVTALAGGLLLSVRLVRSLSLPKLRFSAKKIMTRLLAGGGIRPSIVRSDPSMQL